MLLQLVNLAADYGKVNSQTLLSWANMARNSLQMWNGYSSHQLVFGENPNLPNIMSNILPALEGTTSSEIFAQHLNALHVAHKAFIQTEADARIRQDLRNKVRASEQYLKMVIGSFIKEKAKSVGLGQGRACFKMERWFL